jgi:hypothetical protein
MTLTQNKPLLAAVAVALLAIIGWLAFGFFGIQAAFIDDEVNEAGPVFTASAEEQDAVAATEEFQAAMAEANENPSEADESLEDMADDMPGEIVTLVSGEFSGQSRYTIEGQALVLNDGSEQRFLRFEEFSSDNGPDLKIYLRAENGDFVSLGDLKGNIGDQNYEISPDVDLSVFNTVEIWCERFGVGFGSATLA